MHIFKLTYPSTPPSNIFFAAKSRRAFAARFCNLSLASVLAADCCIFSNFPLSFKSNNLREFSDRSSKFKRKKIRGEPTFNVIRFKLTPTHRSETILQLFGIKIHVLDNIRLCRVMLRHEANLTIKTSTFQNSRHNKPLHFFDHEIFSAWSNVRCHKKLRQCIDTNVFNLLRISGEIEFA